MKLIVDIPDTQYNNIMEVKSMCLGRLPYKGIVMNAINGIKKGTPIPDNATVDVLDKIRAEVIDLIAFNTDGDYISEAGQGMQDCLEIINRYREGVSD